MAKVDAVWGIDIGNSSLKALRCRLGDSSDQLVADAFDYIEYPKITTQPGADPEALVREALQQFQSRNTVRGDRVAVAVSGQSGLARFIKLPPVEAKRIPDIVKYEAKQQIPFDLDDVIWDYQRIATGMEMEGFVLEAEVGLFAIKRDQVFQALEPLREAGLDVDFVQLTPLALYNFLRFDQLNELPSADEYDPDDPPPSYIILSMGTDATDLVVTNGYRVWQRSIPKGGNHFTKALTKELKLTFAKAEHLKRNAASAPDAKAVFQAMRPEFNDLLTEIQRSITYFSSIDRSATIEKIVPVGNAMKLPGLRRYLAQSLGFEVVKLDRFEAMFGPEVVEAPAFKENLLSFASCYGLALQGLDKAAISTNLLPEEIVKDRFIRRKKPWVVAAAASLLLGFTVSYAGYSRDISRMSESRFGSAEQEAASAVSESGNLKSTSSSAETDFWGTDEIGQHLTSNVEGRIRWLELLRAINQCLPRDPVDNRPEDIALRNEVHIESVQCGRMEDLADWFAWVQQNRWYVPAGEAKTAPAPGPGVPPGAVPPAAAAPGLPTAEGPDAAGESEAIEGPSGAGWIVQLSGYHYHNPEVAGSLMGAQFVREKLMKNLAGVGVQVVLPKVDEMGAKELVAIGDLGISFPVLINPKRIFAAKIINPTAEGSTGAGGSGMGGYGGAEGMMEYGATPGGEGAYGPRAGRRTPSGEEKDPHVNVRRFDFVVQFCWQPKLPSERHSAAQAAAAEQGAPGEPQGEVSQ